MSRHSKALKPLAAVLLLLAFSDYALAQSIPRTGVDTDSPSLPPDTGAYFSGPSIASYTLPGGPTVIVSEIQVTPLAGTAQRTFSGGNEMVTFQALVSGNFQDPPFSGMGSISVTVFRRPNDTMTGIFFTQMTSMDLTGSGGGHQFEFILDPNHPTTGRTSVNPQPLPPGPSPMDGGTFHIDSFFDVFTDLSLDHGPFIPANGPTTMVLGPNVPEPGTLALLAVGAVGMAGYGWRRPSRRLLFRPQQSRHASGASRIGCKRSANSGGSFVSHD